MPLILIQICQIIWDPAQTEKQTKEQADYQHKNSQWIQWFFTGIRCFDVMFDAGKGAKPAIPSIPWEGGICAPGASHGRARLATKAADYSIPGCGWNIREMQ